MNGASFTDTLSALPAGMAGEPLPYTAQSDWLVTVLLAACFVLFSLTMRNGGPYIRQRIKRLFKPKERISLFDEYSGSDNRYVFSLGSLTCIVSGIGLYCITVPGCPPLAQADFRLFLPGIYVLTAFGYILFKWGAYNFVNWIFFDNDRKEAWIKSYFDLLGGAFFLLFPFVLAVVYLNPPPPVTLFSALLIACFIKILLFYKCMRNFFNHFHGTLHLILYFCTLEVVPLVLFGKGIAYVNNILILNF